MGATKIKMIRTDFWYDGDGSTSFPVVSKKMHALRIGGQFSELVLWTQKGSKGDCGRCTPVSVSDGSTKVPRVPCSPNWLPALQRQNGRTGREWVVRWCNHPRFGKLHNLPYFRKDCRQMTNGWQMSCHGNESNGERMGVKCFFEIRNCDFENDNRQGKRKTPTRRWVFVRIEISLPQGVKRYYLYITLLFRFP